MIKTIRYPLEFFVIKLSDLMKSKNCAMRNIIIIKLSNVNNKMNDTLSQRERC